MPKTIAGRVVSGLLRFAVLSSFGLIFAFSFALAPASNISCIAQDAGRNGAAESARSQIVGSWRGNSVCTVANSPCHDETNVYRFSEIAGKPASFSVTASKVVDGKEVVMGTGEWKYDAENKIMEGETPKGTLRFKVDGKKMEGNLTLRDGTLYRRIYLKKD